MSGFASEEYNSCKTWIAAQIQAGATWEQVKNLCVSPEFIDRELERLKYDELIIPLKMDLNMWRDLVKDIEGSYSPIVEMYGISADGNSNTLPIPTDSGSAWVRYKNSLLGKYTRKPKMSEAAVASIEKNSHWILNHIKRGMSSRNKTFLLHEMLRYTINSDFPRITPESFIGGVLPAGVTGITYTVDLSGMTSESMVQGANHDI